MSRIPAIEKIAWGGWPNCWRIANGEVDLVVTGDVGPRIMRYGFIGGQNLFKVFEDQAGKSGEPVWQLRGGHRIWLAPEDAERTYAPDNEAVDIEVHGGMLTATQPVEPSTGLQKQIAVKLAPAGTAVEVIHRMKNSLPFAIRIAPWAVTMLAPGGTAVTGFPPRARHEDVLAPSNPLVMWAFTDLRDRRWTFLEKYLVLRHDPREAAHTKLGHFNENTWGAYLLGSDLFVKRYRADATKTYPDMGCSYETFASADMLEIETLGPLTEVKPDAWIEHVEHWSLHRGVIVPDWTDAVLERVPGPLLEG